MDTTLLPSFLNFHQYNTYNYILLIISATVFLIITIAKKNAKYRIGAGVSLTRNHRSFSTFKK